MGDITGLYLFQVSICKTLEVDELDHPVLQGNKGQLDQKDQKVYSEGKTTKIDMKGKTKIVNANCERSRGRKWNSFCNFCLYVPVIN